MLFLRLVHTLVRGATPPKAGSSTDEALDLSCVEEPEDCGASIAHFLVGESLKNLLLVISADPAFANLRAPKAESEGGESLLEATFQVVGSALPELHRELGAILAPPSPPTVAEDRKEEGATLPPRSSTVAEIPAAAASPPQASGGFGEGVAAPAAESMTG